MSQDSKLKSLLVERETSFGTLKEFLSSEGTPREKWWSVSHAFLGLQPIYPLQTKQMLTWPSAKPPLKTRTFKGKPSSSPSQPKTNNKHPTCPSCKSEAWETTSRGGGQMLRKIQSPTYLFTAIHFLLVVLGSYQLGTTKKIKYITTWLHRWRRNEVPVFLPLYFEHIENLRTIHKGDVVFFGPQKQRSTSYFSISSCWVLPFPLPCFRLLPTSILSAKTVQPRFAGGETACVSLLLKK